jgi:hypothetical protein
MVLQRPIECTRILSKFTGSASITSRTWSKPRFKELQEPLVREGDYTDKWIALSGREPYGIRGSLGVSRDRQRIALGESYSELRDEPAQGGHFAGA